MTDLVDIGFRANTSELQRATRDLDQFEQATKDVTAATDGLAKKTTENRRVIDQNYSTTNRATQATDKFGQEINDTSAAIDKMSRHTAETTRVIDRNLSTTTQATARTRTLAEAKSQAAMAAQNYASRLGPIGGLLSAIGPAGLAAAAAIGGLTVAINKSINVANQFDKINAALRIAAGSASLAQKEFEFLAENASKLGIDLQSSALQFARFSAAAKGSALEGEAARDIFIGISQASVALGLSSDEASRAFIAIQQSASKGKVSAEELKQQLGEAIPRAVPLLAEAMGISVAALDKMLERGEVGVENLALLGKAFQEFYGPEAQNMASQYQGSLAALGNEMDLLFNLMGQQAQDVLSPVFRSGAAAAKSLRMELERLGEDFKDTSGAQAANLSILKFFGSVGELIPGVKELGEGLRDLGGREAFLAEVALRDLEVQARNLENQTGDLAEQILTTGDFAADFSMAFLGVADASRQVTDNLVETNSAVARAEEQFVAVIGPIEETSRLYRALQEGGVSAMEEVAAAVERHNEVAAIANELIKNEGMSREIARAAAEAHISRLERINEAKRQNEIIDQNLIEINKAVEAAQKTRADRERKRAAEREAESQAERDRLAKEEEARRRALLEPILEAGRAIQRNLADAFREVFDGNIRGFRDFFDSVVDIAKNAAAQIAAAFATQNILSFLRGGGPVGLGGFAQQAFGAAGGGGGAGGGAAQLAQVASLFSRGGGGASVIGAGGLAGSGLGSGFLGVGGLFQTGGAFGTGGGGLAQIFGLGKAGSLESLLNTGTGGFTPSALGSAVNTAGVGALGAGAGVLLADILGNQSTMGGAIGGAAGAIGGMKFGASLGMVGGPVGAAIGALLGGAIGAFAGGKQDKGSLALQTGGSGFTGGISTQSAFGTIGLGRGTADIGGDLAQTLLGAVAQADALVAGALTQEQIAAVRNALQGTGQIVGTGRGNKYFEQAFGKAIADRFLKIFEALGIAAPSGLSGLARADGTAGSATAGDVLGLALPALSSGLGLDNQASSSIVDQLVGASGPSSDLLGNIGTELVVGNQIQENNGRTLREIRNAIDSLTDEVRRRGSGALA